MPNELTDSERQLAKQVADRAMIAGWQKAISWAASEYGVGQNRIRQILNQTGKYNDKADPAGRIHELEDWEREKQDRSRLVPARAGVSPKPSMPTGLSPEARADLRASRR